LGIPEGILSAALFSSTGLTLRLERCQLASVDPPCYRSFFSTGLMLNGQILRTKKMRFFPDAAGKMDRQEPEWNFTALSPPRQQG